MRCEIIDEDGLAILRGAAPRDLRRSIFDLLFRGKLGKGQCGGDLRKGRVRGADRQPFEVSDTLRVQLGEGVGVQGQHTVDTNAMPALTESGPIADLLQQCRAVSDSPLPVKFCPDTVETSFINTRTPDQISTKKTWCGWSFDSDLTKSPSREKVNTFNNQTQRWEYSGDPTPKLYLNLGNSAVTWGFKYSKKEEDCLECTLQPGDAIVRWGAARSWCSALIGIRNVGGSPELPFTFLHVKVADHKSLQQAQPGLYRKLHDLAKYQGSAFQTDKWFQYSWRWVEGDTVEISNVNQVDQVLSGNGAADTSKNTTSDTTMRTEVISETDGTLPPPKRAKETRKDKPSKTDGKMNSLQAQLQQHCNDDSLIKGWEVSLCLPAPVFSRESECMFHD